jgi:hypothetical protein
MKKLFILILGVLFLSGCSMFFSESTKQNPPTNHNIQCQGIKDKIIFKQGQRNNDYDNWNTPDKQAQLMREYRKYDCENKD